MQRESMQRESMQYRHSNMPIVSQTQSVIIPYHSFPSYPTSSAGSSTSLPTLQSTALSRCSHSSRLNFGPHLGHQPPVIRQSSPIGINTRGNKSPGTSEVRSNPVSVILELHTEFRDQSMTHPFRELCPIRVKLLGFRPVVLRPSSRGITCSGWMRKGGLSA